MLLLYLKKRVIKCLILYTHKRNSFQIGYFDPSHLNMNKMVSLIKYMNKMQSNIET